MASSHTFSGGQPFLELFPVPMKGQRLIVPRKYGGMELAARQSYKKIAARLLRVSVGNRQSGKVSTAHAHCSAFKRVSTPRLHFLSAAMKQQGLSPNLMLILWLVVVPAAVMGAAIAGGDNTKSFAESENTSRRPWWFYSKSRWFPFCLFRSPSLGK